MTGRTDGSQLRLLTVHAHPDDEASKGASTVAACAGRDVHCVLVCCTGGEAGDILNPAMDRPEVRENLPEVRAEELDRAASIIGYHEVVMLGYHDSGMADDEHNAHPEAFANADLDEAVGRLVAVIRRVRPHVIVTYPDERRGYKHPDHLQVHDISLPAFEAAGVAALVSTCLDATRRHGTTVVVGVDATMATTELLPVMLALQGKRILGTLLGDCHPQRDIPMLVAAWRAGRLDLEGMVSHRLDLAEVNEGMDRLRQAAGIRTVLEVAGS